MQNCHSIRKKRDERCGGCCVRFSLIGVLRGHLSNVVVS